MFWGAVLPFVERAMEESAYDTPQSVYDAIKEERAVLWVVWKDGEIIAVCVTQLSQSAKAKTCSIWIMTGRGLRDYIHLYQGIEDYARAEGCNRMRHKSRPGYVKLMKKYGYQMTHAVIEKAL